MTSSSVALPPYAMEVPITGKLDALHIPTLEIDAVGGPTKFDFKPATRVGCSLNSNVQNPIALSASQDDSKALIWELDSEKPCVLSLRHFSVDGGEEDIAVHYNFSAPILPSISSCFTTNGTKLFCVTADGDLHVITHHSRINSNNIAPVIPVFSKEAVHSTSFASAFDRLGAPTALLYVQGTICIGTSLGYILCLPADSPTPEVAFELDSNAGLLNNLISGFFNRGKSQDVEQLIEIRFMDKSFLCSLHCGGVLRLWDLTTKKLVHSCDLIPPEEAAAHKATLARVAGKNTNDKGVSLLLPLTENGKTKERTYKKKKKRRLSSFDN
jgi:WD40 repeat protein